MRKTAELIEENNWKRELLHPENEKVYNDFLLYVRTDLRVDEHAGEEILMDLLDHLVEAQEEGKTATDLFGESPQQYADEVISNLPRENRRNVTWFVSTQIINLAGWFAAVFGLVNLIVSFFKPVSSEIAAGTLVIMLLSVMLVAYIGVSVIFKIVRSSVFQDKSQQRKSYVKAGLYGAAAFALIYAAAWLFTDAGPVITLEWWAALLIGLSLLLISRLMNKVA